MWNKAYELSLNELKKSPITIVLSWIVIIVATAIIIILYNVMESPDPYHDILLIIIVTALPLFFRRKVFRANSGGKMRSSEMIIYYNGLPIPKKIIAKQQIFIYIVYCIPAYIGMMIILYTLDKVVNQLSIGQFLLFVIVMLSVSFFFGLTMLLGDFGSKFHDSIFWVIVSTIIFIVVFFGVILGMFSQFSYERGLLLRGIELMTAHPYIALFISLLIVLISIGLFPKIAERKLRKLDF